MGVPYKPHTATVTEPESRKAGAVGGQPAETPEVTVRCLVEPLSPRTAYERFGIEIERPYELFADSEAGFVVGGTVRAIGLKFAIRAIQPFEVGLSLNHARVLLEVKR